MTKSNSRSISEQDSQQPFGETGSPLNSDQLAVPLTENERADSWKQLSKLHPANRFRLMFGQPLLPAEPKSGKSP